MNMRHSYLYGTAGLSKWELEHPDPVDPDQDDYADRVYQKVSDDDD